MKQEKVENASDMSCCEAWENVISLQSQCQLAAGFVSLILRQVA